MSDQTELPLDFTPPPRGVAKPVPRHEAQPHVYTISELTSFIKQTLEEELRNIWVEGEISNFRRMASGHAYFTLKDARAQLSAVIFAGAGIATQEFRDGVSVRAWGEISVYEPRGQYQLIIRKCEAAGAGANMLKFEALKKRLLEEGLFDASRKRPLPVLPRHIGIVTSPTGAAIEDMLNILGRRFETARVTLSPARVQGDGASAEMVAALALLVSRPAADRPDVIIIGRGGGSLEDLWCFNDEGLARAVAASPVPVVSAVGHETDFTICDFAADLRAPTPSAAAELVIGRKEDFENDLRALTQRLANALHHAHARASGRLAVVLARRAFREPGRLTEPFTQRLDQCALRLAQAMETFPLLLRPRLDALAARLNPPLVAALQQRHARLESFERHLGALNPLAVLQRGYSLTTLEDGTLVRDAAQVANGARIRTQVARGKLRATVDGTEN